MENLKMSRMLQLKLENNQVIDVKASTNKRCKSIRLKITPSQDVEITMPSWSYMKKAMDFLEDKSFWVSKKLSSMPERNIVTNESSLKILDKTYVIKYDEKNYRGISNINGDKILIYGDERLLRVKIIKLIKEFLLKNIIEIADEICDKLKVKYNKIFVRDTKTRWGSCSSNANIAFSWKLAFAPYEVLRYVVIHEIAHLLEFNHSKKFWAIVESYCPEYKKSIYYLRQHSAYLHSHLS